MDVELILGAVVGDVMTLGGKVGKKILAVELTIWLAQIWTFGIGTMVAAQVRVYVDCFGGVEVDHGVGAKDCRG